MSDMSITAVIEGIHYQLTMCGNLKKFDLETLDINKIPTSCIIQDRDNEFALSKWLSPKRTRSFPYARVYNSLQKAKRLTVIPTIKDEGIGGVRDFIQWDTISLMSLLEVYVIFGCYTQANISSTNPNKITNQKFDNSLVLEKIQEFRQYQSSALHWNLKELRETFPNLLNQQIEAYKNISHTTGVRLKPLRGFESFKRSIQDDVNAFMESSRRKAEQAQSREIRTTHIGEYLETITKASITITNYIGGKYFFTVDEVTDYGEYILLTEAKNTDEFLLPKSGDIKDGLLKMMLYQNLDHVYRNEERRLHKASLKLTSPYIKGNIRSTSPETLVQNFLSLNSFSRSDKQLIQQVFNEANSNHFMVQIGKS